MALYDAEDVFQMAVQMEESGKSFYDLIARECDNQAVTELCSRLSAEEQKHLDKFQAMREAAKTRPDVWRPPAEKMGFIRAIVEEQVVPLLAEGRKIAKDGDVAEVLDTAIQMEKDSVFFYVELLGLLDAADAAAVSRIIEEERRHEQELSEARLDLA